LHVRTDGGGIGGPRCIPDSGEDVTDQGPDPLEAVVNRVDLVGQWFLVAEWFEDHEIVGDDSAGCVSAVLRIGESQGHLGTDTYTQVWFILDA
jgi:hypothetical protein